MYWRIKKLRPKVSDADFSLDDDGTGSGPVISRWESSETQPTDEEIASVDDSKPTWFIAKKAIKKLESQETPRRLAEALPDDAGGSAEGRAWLKANRDKIILERAKL